MILCNCDNSQESIWPCTTVISSNDKRYGQLSTENEEWRPGFQAHHWHGRREAKVLQVSYTNEQQLDNKYNLWGQLTYKLPRKHHRRVTCERYMLNWNGYIWPNQIKFHVESKQDVTTNCFPMSLNESCISGSGFDALPQMKTVEELV